MEVDKNTEIKKTSINFFIFKLPPIFVLLFIIILLTTFSVKS